MAAIFFSRRKVMPFNRSPILKVLWIEDNYPNLALVKRIVEIDGYIDFYSANNGTKGLVSAQENKLDLILLDIKLPEINGFQVLKKLKENKETENIPVVAISAHAMEMDIDKAKEAGFEDYCIKPFKMDTLLNILNKYKNKSPKNSRFGKTTNSLVKQF